MSETRRSEDAFAKLFTVVARKKRCRERGYSLARIKTLKRLRRKFEKVKSSIRLECKIYKYA